MHELLMLLQKITMLTLHYMHVVLSVKGVFGCLHHVQTGQCNYCSYKINFTVGVRGASDVTC